MEDFNTAPQKIEGQKGKLYVTAKAGRLLEGTVSQKLELPHGLHIIFETHRSFLAFTMTERSCADLR